MPNRDRLAVLRDRDRGVTPMGDPARYFIRDDYVENPVVATMDHLSGQKYWSARRVKAANYFQYEVYRYVEKLALRLRARKIVDIGCGVGTKLQRISERVPESDIYGIDQPSAIEYCQSNNKFGTWIADDFENPGNVALPSDPDIIICSDVIEHVADPDLLLNYISAMSGPATHIVISTPERDRMRGTDCTHCPHPQHVREWNSQEFQSYVESRGFRVQETLLLPSYRRNLRPAFLIYEVRRIVKLRPRLNNQMVLLRIS
jgi:trans-aconitate methyltransferase